MFAMSRIAPAFLDAVTLAATPAVTAETWNVDEVHSEINFKVNHFFTPVSGTFSDFDIDLEYDAASPANSSVDFRIRRQDFGVGVGSWAATPVVGGNVDIEIAVEANQT